MADRRRNRDLLHLLWLRRLGIRCFYAWIVGGACLGWALGIAALRLRLGG